MHRTDDESLIRRAAEILRTGGLVAFPTETVYGLGADATNSVAVRKIFAAKGRPSTNPLIVHITGAEMARRHVTHWPASATLLSDRFWPGPLTLVLPKTPDIAGEVSAGLTTIGLRAPSHPIAQNLLGALDRPIAAPSANRSQRISPTTADHVREELGPSVDFILDGGPCTIGIESTVLDLTSKIPTLLRPGAISLAELQETLGEIRTVSATLGDSTPAHSPGQQAVHYSPTKPTFRFGSDDVEDLLQFAVQNSKSRTTLLALQNSPSLPRLNGLGACVHLVLLPSDPAEYARNFYSILRAADADASQSIWIELPPVDEKWHALRDRITRASRPAADSR